MTFRFYFFRLFFFLFRTEKSKTNVQTQSYDLVVLGECVKKMGIQFY